MAQPEILRLENVTLKFANTTSPAVAGVTLSLVTGEVLGLLGPSGCGKTTLLRIVAGFVSPQTGTVAIAGRMVAGQGCWIPPEQRHVGMVFQDYALFPHLTVAANIAFGLRAAIRRTGKESDRQQRVTQLMALVGLEGLENRYPHELSGGQQQRVALARALAPQPKLLLLDEPLSNLDVQVRLRLRQEVREILKATGISGIFVTHDQQEALAIADRVAVMCQGRLEQFATPQEIYTQPASRFVAEFVTQANFIPARRRGQVWETELGCFKNRRQDKEDKGARGQGDKGKIGADFPHFPLTKTPPLLHQPLQEVGDLMIREEDLILQPADDGLAVIQMRYFLGREYRYCLQIPSGRRLYARTPAQTVLPVGTRVNLSVVEQAFKFFPQSCR